MNYVRKNTGKLLILFSIVLFVFAGCSKNSGNKYEDEKGLLDKTDVVLQKGMSISGFRIDDTLNNIKGKVVFPRNMYKDEDNINIDPAMLCWERDLKVFADKVKSFKEQDKTDKNIYELKIRSITEFEDIISAVYEKKTHFNGTKDTIRELLICNYDKDSGKELSFTEVFDVNAKNLKSFNKQFKSDYTLEDLHGIQFYFTQTMVFLTKDTKSMQQDKSAPKKNVKKFMIDD